MVKYVSPCHHWERRKSANQLVMDFYNYNHIRSTNILYIAKSGCIVKDLLQFKVSLFVPRHPLSLPLIVSSQDFQQPYCRAIWQGGIYKFVHFN